MDRPLRQILIAAAVQGAVSAVARATVCLLYTSRCV
ncbi:DUF4235 domain-containing protein [Streptomyces sp. rh34]|nr:DUF4235 domain-containing protein [Streptomyces sp. rh34]